MYPTKMNINGKIYNIDTNYKTAISCYKVLNDSSISDINRGFTIITLLLGEVEFNDFQEALEKCITYLRCGKEQNDSKEDIDMDYVKDEKIIKTSIRQCYHEDISKENLHWYEYNELIEGLTEDTLLSKIREIRNYELPKNIDDETRRKILDAKERVSLSNVEYEELTDDEQNNAKMFDDLMDWK